MFSVFQKPGFLHLNVPQETGETSRPKSLVGTQVCGHVSAEVSRLRLIEGQGRHPPHQSFYYMTLPENRLQPYLSQSTAKPPVSPHKEEY